MSHNRAALDAAASAAEELAVALFEEAIKDYPIDEFENFESWHDVFQLVDETAMQVYGEGLRQCIARLLAEAGVDLPIDPAVYGFDETVILVEAVAEAGSRIAEKRESLMPKTVDDALQQALVQVRSEQQWARGTLRHGGDGSSARVCSVPAHVLSPHFEMGLVIVREGYPALPASEEERSKAHRVLADWLVSDVQLRLSCYHNGISGYVEVREVTLTAEEEASVRAAAREIYPLC